MAKCKITYVLVILFMLTGCSTVRKAFFPTAAVKSEIEKAKEKGTLPKAFKFDKDKIFKPEKKAKSDSKEYFKSDEIEVQAEAGYPEEDTKLVDIKTGKVFTAFHLYDHIKQLVLVDVNEKAEVILAKEENKSYPPWIVTILLLGGAITLGCGVIFGAIFKAPKTGGFICLVGVIWLCIPTFLDAIHAAMVGFTWAFYAALILIFIPIVVCVIRVTITMRPEDLWLPKRLKKKPKKTVRLEQK